MKNSSTILKLKKAKAENGKKTIKYAAIFKTNDGRDLEIRFAYSKKTERVIPMETFFDGKKLGAKLRIVLDETGLNHMTTEDFLHITRRKINSFYNKNLKAGKKTS